MKWGQEEEVEEGGGLESLRPVIGLITREEER